MLSKDFFRRPCVVEPLFPEAPGRSGRGARLGNPKACRRTSTLVPPSRHHRPQRRRSPSDTVPLFTPFLDRAHELRQELELAFRGGDTSEERAGTRFGLASFPCRRPSRERSRLPQQRGRPWACFRRTSNRWMICSYIHCRTSITRKTRS